MLQLKVCINVQNHVKIMYLNKMGAIAEQSCRFLVMEGGLFNKDCVIASMAIFNKVKEMVRRR